MTPGTTRQDWLSYAVRMAVEEGDDFDLLAMGRPEGQGCYCAANHMLRNIIDGINQGYDWVIMDNEAGMEHLSRRTTKDVDHLLLVSDASMRGMVAAEAMVGLSKELEINVRNTYLIVNRVQGELTPELRGEGRRHGRPAAGRAAVRSARGPVRQPGPRADRTARGRVVEPRGGGGRSKAGSVSAQPEVQVYALVS